MALASFHTYRRLLNHHSILTTKDINIHYTELDKTTIQMHDQTLFYLLILLAILLLATLILLYARWHLRFRQLYPSSPSQIAHSTHGPHVPNTVPKGLDTVVIKAMPIILHQGSGIEMECCICLGVFEDGDKVKVLTKCCHRFHSDCVDRWFSGQTTCPLCRVSLQPEVPSSDLESSEV